MTIHICIGTEPKTEIARKVLQHSIRRHTAPEVELAFHPMSSADRPAELQGQTGFSLERWGIPERLGYSGKAIYLDADQLVFGDIRGLWNADERNPREGATAWCVPYSNFWNTSVMLIDCAGARCRWPTMEELEQLLADPAKRRYRYRHLMRGLYLEPHPAPLEPAWNHLDTYQPGTTRLLHFTNRSTQPWFYPRHPLAGLWEEALCAALADGAVTAGEVAAACDRFEMGRYLAIGGMHPDWRRVIAGGRAA